MALKLDNIPFDDPATFNLLSEGHTIGIFQVESPGMVGLLRSVRPDSINDISAVLALYRPGPLDNGSHTEYARRKVRGSSDVDIHVELDGDLEPVLRETHGLIVYQEQVMQIIAGVTGWGYAEAEDIFTAMRKKKLDKMEQSKPAFFEAAKARGYSAASIEALWGVLVPFSDYSFNKSHSLGYAYLTYRGAYLKAHYPKLYMTALLTSAKDTDDISKYLAETTRLGIPVLPPDVNTSGSSFTPDKRGIRYGVAAIKGVGEAATAALISRRPYTSIDDFFRRAHPKVLNSGVLVALCKSGVLDSLWGRRHDLVRDAPELSRVALDERKAAREGQRRLVRTTYRPKSLPEEGEAQETTADWERQLLGVQLTHPDVTLKLNRPLDATEWLWVKQQLTSAAPQSRVLVTLRDTTFTLPEKTTISDTLLRNLELLGVTAQ